jgi:hypothetical protein
MDNFLNFIKMGDGYGPNIFVDLKIKPSRLHSDFGDVGGLGFEFSDEAAFLFAVADVA